MFNLVVLFLTTLCFYDVSSQGECTDLRGRLISHGLHYVPGPDTCTLCVCDNGLPKVCKAVLCSPPQDCRSFRVGTTCCEFICLDDVVKPVEPNEANVKVAAAGAVTVVLTTIALVVYKVRQQKRNRPPHMDDQRSLTSIGYISGSMGYPGGTCETALGAWKPQNNYLPRGEAPPPYDEAMAQTRPEYVIVNNQSAFHRTFAGALEAFARYEPAQFQGQGYGNVSRPVQQTASTQNCFNAPLLQPVHPADDRDGNIQNHPPAPNGAVFPSGVRLTGSLAAISGRAPRGERLPAYCAANVHSSLHRTIPRISTAVDTRLEAVSAFIRTDRSLHSEIRRSFHKPGDHRTIDTGRSMPRNLNLAAGDITVTAELTRDEPEEGASGVLAGGRSRAHSEEQTVSVEPQAKPALKPSANQEAVPPPRTLPLTVDKPSCLCSYEGANAPGEVEDYRSECENCKSASGSRWVLEEGWVEEGAEGTQTLLRHAPPPAVPAPATATLPQPATKTRSAMGPPSNWENWFNTIPDSDTESEDE